MDRRKSIKLMAWSTVSSTLLVDACRPDDKKKKEEKPVAKDPYTGMNRMPEELEAYKKTIAETFFTPHEMATIAVLSDIIIPKDEVSGSATDAKVPDFIEFIVKDKPDFQIPMRGGLRWLDIESAKRFNNAFKDCNAQQQIQIVDDIAYPEKSKPELHQGVAFFTLMRN